MHRRISELSLSHTPSSAKKPQLSKTLLESLADVNQGDYQDFRQWLAHDNIRSLSLANCKTITINLFHLGKALQGTGVTRFKMDQQNIQSQSAKDFTYALSGTQLMQIDWTNNKISAQCAIDFAEGLRGTNVTQVDLSWNQLGTECAKDFAKGLHGTLVTQVDLGFNKICNQGVTDLLTALAGSQVNHLNLMYNPITVAIAHELAALIEKTHLLVLKLPFEDPTINEALRKNQERILITPYEAARLWYLPKAGIEKTKLDSTFKLAEGASEQKQLQYAGGILANTPIEIAQHIISFLPFMNAKQAENVFKAAANKQPTLIESNEKAPDEDRPLIIAPSRR